MAYDAVKMADWQISETAEKNMPMPDEWREKLTTIILILINL